MYLTLLPFLLTTALALPDLSPRQSTCPPIHIFGARETTAPAGYGTAGGVITLILNANSGATAEAISYPACGGQSSCGGASYSSSALQGTAAVASAVNAFNARCPSTKLVLVGYSQGGQIMDNAFCGGGDTNIGLSNTAVPISAAAVNMIRAAIFMGDPRHIPGLSYNVGTCQASGVSPPPPPPSPRFFPPDPTKQFAPRPSGFQCPSASKIQSYCDAADPYCCNGNDANTHQGYATEYGQRALAFVNSKLAGDAGTPTTPPASSAPVTQPTQPAAGTVEHWGQCGGQGWTGATVCVSPWTCTASNSWYSQCL